MKKWIWFREMRDFLILWSSQSVSSLGSSMTSYALIIWVYQQRGTASSIALLSFFTYLPSILLCFMAGALADRWDKKRIMLISDLIAALGTLTVLGLFSADQLRIWHLYLVNFVISLMNAFQNPAAYVATSLLAPKQHYVRVGGLQALSNSLVSILTPALATAALAFGGLNTVLIIDLSSFCVAFLTLLLRIRLPAIERAAQETKHSFLSACADGFRFLAAHRALLHLILFFAFVNLLAYITGFGIMPALILSRTGNDQAQLGMVSTALGLGTLLGSILVTAMRPAKNRVRVVFWACAISFALCNPVWAVARTLPWWVFAAFAGNLPLPFLNANLSAIMRDGVPIEMQGRVFSARDTLQYCTIPLGLILGGHLADNAFEPFMQTPSATQALLAPLVGAGPGSGIALMFLITGIVGCISCLLCLKDPAYRDL